MYISHFLNDFNINGIFKEKTQDSQQLIKYI